MANNAPRLIGYHFALLHRLNTALCKQDITGLGIQVSHIPFMAELLHRQEPVTQEELTTTLVIDKAATARALAQLEREGFVIRTVNPENRRQKLVIASDKARKMQQDFFDILQKSAERITGNFSEQEREAATKLLNRMLANAKQSTGS